MELTIESIPLLLADRSKGIRIPLNAECFILGSCRNPNPRLFSFQFFPILAKTLDDHGQQQSARGSNV